jgi:D-aminopeptidase
LIGALGGKIMNGGLLAALAVFALAAGPQAQAEELAPARARDLGVPFTGTPGPLNAITDVAGVEVGMVTLISGEGALVTGKGPVRTGVTAVLPRGRASHVPVFAGWFTLNAAGEMTGTTWLQERGLLDGPVMITNTHSVGVVRDAEVAWMVRNGWEAAWHAPVAAETYDGFLNDINGFHVTKEDAWRALDSAHSGPVQEGVVGGGTGMICNGFKGGTGTSSRRFDLDGKTYTLGVLVQCNYGSRTELRIAGNPFGETWKDRLRPCTTMPGVGILPPNRPKPLACDSKVASNTEAPDGSIIIVVATDAPLLPHQLMRVAKRPALGIGRLGGIARDGSGDIFIAFSTANPGLTSVNPDKVSTVEMFPNEGLSVVFNATVDATEEAIMNSMTMATTTTGVDGHRVYAIPRDAVRDLFAKKP